MISCVVYCRVVLIALLVDLSLAAAAAAAPYREFRALQEENNTVQSDDGDDAWHPSYYQFECEPPCDPSGGTFCGSDLRCHPHNCDDWYTLGHPNMTGYDPDVSSELECTAFEEDDKDTSFLGRAACAFSSGYLPYAVSIDYECSSSSDPCNSNRNKRGVRFNRKCTARPNATTGFVCYDIAPGTDVEAYFGDFVEATHGLVDQNGVEACEANNQSVMHQYTQDHGGLYFRYVGSAWSSDFNASLAASAFWSDYFLVDEESLPKMPVCESGCVDTEFCGTDGVCHRYDCFNIYKYGPPEITGVKTAEGDIELTTCQVSPPEQCRDWKTGVEEAESMWPVAVAYRCQGNPSYGQLDECAYPILAGRYITFNIYCTAKPNPNQIFTCYGIDPAVDMDTYMADYLENLTSDSTCTLNTTRIPDPSEDEGWYYGSTQFQACIGYQTPNDSGSNCAKFNKFFSADEEFDQEFVRSAMISDISGEPPSSSAVSSSRRVSMIYVITAIISLYAPLLFAIHRGS